MSTADHRGYHRTRVYLAAPLFSEAERTFNVRVTELLEEFAQVYLPQRDGGLMSEMVATGMPTAIAARRVFRRDIDAIRQADYVIAILDGRAIDEGVSFELGVAFSQTNRCVGLQTDSRRLAAWGNNPMITGALEIVFMSVDDLMEWVRASLLVNRSTSHKDWQLRQLTNKLNDPRQSPHRYTQIRLDTGRIIHYKFAEVSEMKVDDKHENRNNDQGVRARI